SVERNVSGGARVENDRPDMLELRFAWPISCNDRLNAARLLQAVREQLALMLVHVRAKWMVRLGEHKHDFRRSFRGMSQTGRHAQHQGHQSQNYNSLHAHD